MLSFYTKKKRTKKPEYRQSKTESTKSLELRHIDKTKKDEEIRKNIASKLQNYLPSTQDSEFSGPRY